MKSANITHCQHTLTYGFVLLGKVIISLLQVRQGALQNRHCAALPGSIVGHTNSGQSISFWSLRTAVLRSERGFHDHLAFPFWRPGALGVRVIQNNTEYGEGYWCFCGSPRRSFVACSLYRDCDDLFFFDFVSSCSSVALRRAMPFVSSSARFLCWNWSSLSASLCGFFLICFSFILLFPFISMFDHCVRTRVRENQFAGKPKVRCFACPFRLIWRWYLPDDNLRRC